MVVENQLGSDLYIKRIEQNSEVVDQLHHGDFASVWVPPARFSDRLNVAEESRQARYYVAAQILFAKVLNDFKFLQHIFHFFLTVYFNLSFNCF